MIVGRPKGQVGPFSISELINGGPAPLDGVKRVAALDRVASCEQVGYRHDADGPFRNNFRHYKCANGRV